MHFILSSVGTDGDIFPYLGLGVQLLARGHRVTLAAPEPYRNRAEALGMAFCPIVTNGEVEQMLGNPNLWHPFRSGVAMAKWGAPMIPRQYETLATLANQPDCVIVANPGVMAARLAGEKLGIRVTSLILQPGVLPSCIGPPQMSGGLTIPKWFPHFLRRLYWLGFDAAGYLLIGRSLNRFRATLGLPPVRRFFRWWLSPELVIGLFPSWYAPPQPDWPAQLRLAGFGRFDGGKGELPDALRTFCENGPPPIAFTLGTGMRHANPFFRTAVAVCQENGFRGILLSKYQEVIPSPLPASVIHFTYAPFRQLLPVCGAFVHHGGIGTTAAALETGCPQLVLPLAWDQPDNAARIIELGAGLTLGPRQRSVKEMGLALSRLSTLGFGERCREIAPQAKKEDGIEVAANRLEEWAKNTDTRAPIR